MDIPVAYLFYLIICGAVVGVASYTIGLRDEHQRYELEYPDRKAATRRIFRFEDLFFELAVSYCLTVSASFISVGAGVSLTTSLGVSMLVGLFNRGIISTVRARLPEVINKILDKL